MANENDIKAYWFDCITELTSKVLNLNEMIESMKKQLLEKDEQIKKLTERAAD